MVISDDCAGKEMIAGSRSIGVTILHSHSVKLINEQKAISYRVHEQGVIQYSYLQERVVVGRVGSQRR